MSVGSNGGAGGTSTQGGGGTGGEGGGGQGGGGGTSGGQGGGGQTVSKAELDRVLGELHGLKTENKALKDEKAKQEEEQLKASQNYKELAERHEKTAKEWEGKYTGLNSLVIKDKKLSAVREEAIKAGIRPEAIEDLASRDLKEVSVVVNTSTGAFEVSGAGNFVQQMKTLRPHWFGGNTGPGVNTTTPNINGTGAGEKVTLEQVKAAEKKARSGDASAKSEYQRLHKALVEQSRAKRA